MKKKNKQLHIGSSHGKAAQENNLKENTRWFLTYMIRLQKLEYLDLDFQPTPFADSYMLACAAKRIGEFFGNRNWVKFFSDHWKMNEDVLVSLANSEARKAFHYKIFEMELDHIEVMIKEYMKHQK